MSFRSPRPRSPRRGVTLIEMLVSVALLVLMMTILVTIFKAATGSVTALRHYQELDGNLRHLDSIIRQDLNGVTARLTPPLDPKNNLGYLEYIENQFADVQGEDTDDCLRFTAKAPEGQLFTGRCWIGSPYTDAGNTIPRAAQPVVFTSQYAEIIYFLRNGNLYRRVLLIAPDKQSSIVNASGYTFPPDFLANTPVSWQGVNDISAHPTTSGLAAALLSPIQLNTLGDLTNRENRFASPRFGNDFNTLTNITTVTSGGDGVADDLNFTTGGTANYTGDGVPDYYPTLFPNVFNTANPNPLIFESSNGVPSRFTTYDAMAFPYIFPGAYSQPDPTAGSLSGLGWIHSTDPTLVSTTNAALDQLANVTTPGVVNHNPLQAGDNLPRPQTNQTYFGFPTWRETISAVWSDPGYPVASNVTNGGGSPLQPNGLRPFSPTLTPSQAYAADNTKVFLPPMTTSVRGTEQPFNDGFGTTNLVGAAWPYTWEDDLVMVGVRSFDVKAYDNSFPGYVDLGWGDDVRLYQPYGYPPYTLPAGYVIPMASGPFHNSTPAFFMWPPAPGVSTYNTISQTLAHEGRMPPLVADLRMDPNFFTTFAGYTTYTGNVGDDTTDVIRLRRVWDTWSTAYTNAPATGFDPNSKLPVGTPFSPPVYPSYPPPYPAPLRGLQIQIRVVDPRNEQVKTLTIRQDFTERQ